MPAPVVLVLEDKHVMRCHPLNMMSQMTYKECEWWGGGGGKYLFKKTIKFCHENDVFHLVK